MSMDENLPDLSNKSVVLYVTANFGIPRWATEGIVLESPSFQIQGNRLFLVGRTPGVIANTTEEDDWSANQVAALAWDSVLYYIVMPSEEYQTKMQVPERQPLYNRWLNYFIIVMGALLSITLLIGIVVWIIKML